MGVISNWSSALREEGFSTLFPSVTWPWPNDLHIRTWPIVRGHRLHVEIWTPSSKLSKVIAWQTYSHDPRPKLHTPLLHGWSNVWWKLKGHTLKTLFKGRYRALKFGQYKARWPRTTTFSIHRYGLVELLLYGANWTRSKKAVICRRRHAVCTSCRPQSVRWCWLHCAIPDGTRPVCECMVYIGGSSWRNWRKPKAWDSAIIHRHFQLQNKCCAGRGSYKMWKCKRMTVHDMQTMSITQSVGWLGLELD